MFYNLYYFQDYFIFLGAILICAVFSAIASARVRSTFKKYNGYRCSSGLTGVAAADKLLKSRGIYDISLGAVDGELSDHYDPRKGIVNLSKSTYGSNSVAAVAVAAHEIGHVTQNKDGHLFYKIRSALVPVVNFGSYLAMPLVLVGLVLDYFVAATANSDLGFYVAMIGVILYGSSFLFTLITYPVEVNASRRAVKMLLENHIIADSEAKAAKKVLSAAVLTYFVSLLTSLVYFLRFLLYVLALFGKRNRR